MKGCTHARNNEGASRRAFRFSAALECLSRSAVPLLSERWPSLPMAGRRRSPQSQRLPSGDGKRSEKDSPLLAETDVDPTSSAGEKEHQTRREQEKTPTGQEETQTDADRRAAPPALPQVPLAGGEDPAPQRIGGRKRAAGAGAQHLGAGALEAPSGAARRSMWRADLIAAPRSRPPDRPATSRGEEIKCLRDAIHG